MGEGRSTWWDGRDWRIWLVIAIAAAAVYLPGIDHPLRDAEAKYAQIPYEMLQSGDWLSPRLNHADYYVKPPLTYWPTAALYAVFGVSEAAARLTNLLLAFLSAFLLGRLGRRLFDPQTGLLAAVAMLLTTEVFVYCLDAGLEFGLIAMVLLAFLCFWRWRASDRLVDLCLFHAALGLAFLAKGLPGWAIGLGSASLVLAICDRRALPRLYHPAGLASFLAVAGPWVAVMTSRHPEFLQVFVVNEHVHRFIGAMRSNDSLFPTGLWLLLVTGEFFPWVLHLPGAGVQLARMVRAGAVDREKAIFLGVWAALPLALYTTSRSKVDFYGLEVYPPLLLAIAVTLMDLIRDGRFASRRAWAAPWWGAAAAAAVGLAVLVTNADADWVRDLGIPSIPVALMFLAAATLAGGAAALLFTRGRPALALLAVGSLCIVLFQVQRVTYRTGHDDASARFAADLYGRYARDGDVLVSDERPEFEHVAGLVFYTGRQVLILRDREDSIMHFIEPDRDALCIDEAALRRLAAGGHRIFLLGDSDAIPPRLADLGLASTVLGSGGDRSLFMIGSAPTNPREGVEFGP